MFNRILVICTGNICRSPMGEIMLRERLTDSKITVASAGVGAVVGADMHPHTRTVLQEHDFPADTHCAAQFNLQHVQDYDLILALDKTHKNWVEGKYPQARGKVMLMGHWQQQMDIPDPIKQPKDEFDKTYALLDQCVNDWVKRLK